MNTRRSWLSDTPLMHRYLAIAWNVQAPDEVAAAELLLAVRKRRFPGWIQVAGKPGLSVYLSRQPTRAFRVYNLQGLNGLVLGTLMTHRPAGGWTYRESLNEREAKAVLASSGQYLIDSFWGRYVLLMQAGSRADLIALRDPTGALPCFVTMHRGVRLACSHVGDCDSLGAVAVEIDWEHVAAYLQFDNMITAHTGLKCVRHVQAGERVELRKYKIDSHYCWSPNRVFGSCRIDDRMTAVREIRSTLLACVSAWGSCYDSVLHELSGGLDSAVVLAALSLSGCATRVLCENHYTSDVEADERRFARMAAEAAGVELIETAIPAVNGTLDEMLENKRVASPAQVAFIAATTARRDEIVQQYGIDAIFSGQGGDHFFQSVRSAEIAAEFFLRHGIDRRLLGVVGDTSRFVRKSYWSILGTVVSSGLCRRRVDPYATMDPSPLLADELRRDPRPQAIRHPWIDSALDLPNCKRRQIFDIVNTQNFYRVPEQAADIVHPLISQPVIELCLQIPSYHLTYGGRDRALVRDAFAHDVPAEILSRRVKGATTGYFNNLLVKNIPFLREYILGGLLADSGLIDKDRTAAALTEAGLTRGGTLIFPVLDALRAEFWLRLWSPAVTRHRREAGY